MEGAPSTGEIQEARIIEGRERSVDGWMDSSVLHYNPLAAVEQAPMIFA